MENKPKPIELIFEKSEKKSKVESESLKLEQINKELKECLFSEESEEQRYFKRNCKVCHKERVFVNNVGPTNSLVCCTCRFTTSLVPINLNQNQFGLNMK